MKQIFFALVFTLIPPAFAQISEPQLQDEAPLETQISSILDKMRSTEEEIRLQREEMGLKDDAEVDLTNEEIELLEQVVTGETETKMKTEIEIPAKPVIPWKAIDIFVPDNPRVEKARVMYLTNFSKQRLYQIMSRARPYQAFIRKKLREYNMPQALEYLPAIESGFNAKAVSRAGAVGMWQFMKNSVSPYGIKINEWVDERKDPWLMTDAALKKLQENYKALGDWYLALAAYNAGLGGMRSRVKKYGTNDYWKLCEKGAMKSETADYVPRFLAVAEILTNAEYYGLELPPEVDEPQFAVLETTEAVDISLLAEKLEIEKDELFFLNPALNYTITPPSSRYKLRLPSDKVAAAQEILRNSDDLMKYDVHKIRSGDTLYDIAKHYEISISMLEKANPNVKPSRLKLGQNILIPRLKEIPPMAIEKVKVDFSENYTVKSGDTLWNLSRIYGVKVEDLAAANGMTLNSALSIGATLKVPKQ